MKSCNTKKREPKRKIFKLIEKPKMAEEFFQIYKPLETLFFWCSARLLRKDPQLIPSVSVSQRCSLTEKWHRHKGKGCSFLWQILLASRKASSPENAPSKHLLCLHLSCSFILIPKYSSISYFVFKVFSVDFNLSYFFSFPSVHSLKHWDHLYIGIVFVLLEQGYLNCSWFLDNIGELFKEYEI